MRRLLLAATLVLCGLPSLAVASDVFTELELSVGSDWSTGDYAQDEDTEILYAPVAVAYTRGPWRGRATIPYLRIDGPTSFVNTSRSARGPGPPPPGGGGGMPPPMPPPMQPASSVEEGLGDIMLELTYTPDALVARNLFLDLTAGIKVPTANEDKGLGTGKTDYSVSVDLASTFGRLSPYAMVGYRLVGRSSDFSLQNSIRTLAGLQVRITDDFRAGFSYEFRESLSKTAKNPSEVLVYLSQRLSTHFTVGLYGVVGLSDGSPDAGFGTSLSYNTN